MELALKDIRRHLGRFLATIAGVAMLLAIVLVMNGIYRGNIEDGVWLIENTATDLWVVEARPRRPVQRILPHAAGQPSQRGRHARRGAGQPPGHLHRAARSSEPRASSSP